MPSHPPTMLPLSQDFRDLLYELIEAEARFLIVGGYAVAVHGHPRATKDLERLGPSRYGSLRSSLVLAPLTANGRLAPAGVTSSPATPSCTGSA